MSAAFGRGVAFDAEIAHIDLRTWFFVRVSQTCPTEAVVQWSWKSHLYIKKGHESKFIVNNKIRQSSQIDGILRPHKTTPKFHTSPTLEVPSLVW